MRTRILGLATIAVAAALAGPALAGSYVYTTLSVPGAYSTQVNGINDAGQVVGNYEVLAPHRYTGGFTWQGGTFNTVAIGADLSFNAINSAGNVAGDHKTLAGPFEGFIYRLADGVISYPLANRPSLQGSQAVIGINDSNTIIGDKTVTVPAFRQTGFVLGGGKLAQVSVPGADVSLEGINNAGVVYGSISSSTLPRRYFYYQNGSMTQLPALDGQYLVSSIDHLGKLTGRTFTGVNQPTQGFVYDSGTIGTFRWTGIVKGSTVVADYTEAVANTPVGVFGTYGFANQNFRELSFVKRGNTFYTLQYPGSGTTKVTAVNGLGDFAGYSIPAPGGPHRASAFVAICPADQRPCTQ